MTGLNEIRQVLNNYQKVSLICGIKTKGIKLVKQFLKIPKLKNILYSGGMANMDGKEEQKGILGWCDSTRAQSQSHRKTH